MRDLTQSQAKRVEELIGQMSLDEKIGQMNLESPSIVGGFDVPFSELIEMMADGRISKEEFTRIMSGAKTDYHEDMIRAGQAGALMIEDPARANLVQRIAVEESRLGIPLLIGYDVIHGLKSVFPIALAEGGSFDRELYEETARMAAREARADGINWVFSPMLDVARDARWGRVSEGPGEDPYLISEFARAKVRGLQGGKEKGEAYAAACIKHYAGYGACEAGRDYNTTSIALHLLYNIYLAPFRAAAEEGAKSVMAAFNDLNGIPCTADRWLIRSVLKDQFGMDGMVVSDANAIRECILHGIAEDDRDAARQAVCAGLDMDMGTEIYLNHLKDLAEEETAVMSAVDEAVRRILSVKMWLGLFENPYVSEEEMKLVSAVSPKHRDLCLKAAEESIVLLKNDTGILPLAHHTKISLVGTLADSEEETAGSWAMAFRKEDCVSIRAGMEKEFPFLKYYPAGGPEGDMSAQDAEAAAEYGDVIVAVLGETAAMSGEASSRADITLPGKQRKILEKLAAAGKPVILVLMNGRPLVLDWEKENIPVILEAWQLGIEMGTAVAKVLCGKKNPEGKLASTFPASVGQCPIYYNHPGTGRPGGRSKFTSKYLDVPFEPLYPFGYGLSYTAYKYSDLSVKDTGDGLKISVQVCNTGEYDGRETVLFFIQDVTASLVRPVKELKEFVKISLRRGETKRVSVFLEKARMGFWNNEGTYCLEDGKFRIFAGRNSEDNLMKEVSVSFL